LSEQLSFFLETPFRSRKGLRYAAEFVSPEMERKLISRIRDLPLQPFQFGQFEGKRRVASFGFRYDYGLRQLQEAEPIPSWLTDILANARRDGSVTRWRRLARTSQPANPGLTQRAS
jgi:hypothetical protein